MADVHLGSWILQPRRQLIADGQRVALGRRALDILSVLAEAEGGIVTKDELFEAVWPGTVIAAVLTVVFDVLLATRLRAGV